MQVPYSYVSLTIVACWKNLTSPGTTVMNESLSGTYLYEDKHTYEECGKLCGDGWEDGCRSFTFCINKTVEERGACWLYDKTLNGSEPLNENRPTDECYSNYRNCSIGNLVSHFYSISFHL